MTTFFFSAGEPSGDLHGANLIAELRRRSPQLRCVGFGGPLMRAAGQAQSYPLSELAVMGVGQVAKHLRTFLHLGAKAESDFRTHRPAALILIDYPGFHWHLAKRAHRYGIPVYYFVPPQLWAWAGYRVARVRRHFTAVLTALPFENEWYQARGVRTHYIGHPFFDEVRHQVLDGEFLAAERAKPGPIIALLPGSRTMEVEMNGPVLIHTADKLLAQHPAVRFLVAAFQPKHAEMMRGYLAGMSLPVEVHVGRTPEIIELCTACAAVSGSVSLELLARRKPSVIVYRMSWLFNALARRLVRLKYLTLVNLLADALLYPEFASDNDDSDKLVAVLDGWLTHPSQRAALVAKLDDLATRVGKSGAIDRAAEFLLAELRRTQPG